MNLLSVYTVYERPDDYPDSFVVRRALVGPGTAVPDEEPLCVVDTLREARLALPPGVIWMDRSPDDAPAILEVWL